MKTEILMPETRHVFAPMSLHSLVSRISDSLSPVLDRNKIVIINNIREDTGSEINESLVSPVLSHLMNLVIMNSENSRIRFTAKMIGNVVLLHVKDDGCLNYNSISQHLPEIQAEAEKMGGFVGFTSYRNKLTTIAFSFTNMHGVDQ
jgi:hypothetical protein